MLRYRNKAYGRNGEVDILYKMFNAGRNVSMHGPRRLGKTFLLDRMVDAGPEHNWLAVKIELAGCADSRAVFRELCSRIGNSQSGGGRAKTWLLQRVGQFLEPRAESAGAWYQPFIALDQEAYFERLIHAMEDDRHHRWALLIDELPIFLKSLHDKGTTGVAAARDFMNLLVRLQQQYPQVRWMITGSIGIEPLAQAGNYMGVLAKFWPFELAPLEVEQAKDYLKDLAHNGQLLNRQEITDAEAQAIVEAVGWRAAFYLDALAQKLIGKPETDPEQAQLAVEAASRRLVTVNEMVIFGTWEEHLRKHYNDDDRNIAFRALAVICQDPQGTDLDGTLAAIGIQGLFRDRLRQVLIRLGADGFLSVDNWEHDSPRCSFLNPLLRRWWSLVRPQPTL